MDLIVGTAGHIDHGKTALIRALTGTDTDRLPEEKQRGITIDLGFAEMDIGDVHIGFVDVPGHERFVKNMLAGVSGIDLIMLIVAADEGVMPQTREHFDICRLLGIRAGLVALTKCDLVDDETLELARLDVAELVAGSFLADVEPIEVSSKTGAGIPELKTALIAAAGDVPVRDSDHAVRLPIDRSFTMKGFGTVVTGTLVSGQISEGDELELLPEGRRVRVRGLQTHGKKSVSVHAGQRTAANLAALRRDEIERGMTLCSAGVFRPTQIIDAELEVLSSAADPLRTRQRVRVHIGTAEVLGRISVLNGAGQIDPGSTGLAQIRFERSVVAAPDERLIIRRYSPQTTIAGGRVIDNLAAKHRIKDLAARTEFLRQLLAAGADHGRRLLIIIEAAGRGGMSFADLQAGTALRSDVLGQLLAELAAAGTIVDAGQHFVAAEPFDELKGRAIGAITDLHRRQPLAKGLAVGELRDSVLAFVRASIVQKVLSSLESDGAVVAEKEFVRLATHRVELSAAETAAIARLRSIYSDSNFEVPRFEDALADVAGTEKMPDDQLRKLFSLLVDAGDVVKVTDEFYFARGAIEKLVQKLIEFKASTSDSMIDVAKFKSITGLSRKYTIPLLEYFDRQHVTTRVGDKRMIL